MAGKNCKNNTCRLGEQPPWRIIFLFAIWLLWKHRNATIFRNLHTQANVHKDALFRSLEFQYCGLNNRNLGNKRVVQVRWESPQMGWACLNTDGAAAGNPGQAGCGGLIRNEHGEWLCGFSRSIGCADSFMAEFWGLRDGLTLYIDLHLIVVDVQLDAKAVVQFLANPSSSNLCALPLLDDYKKLLSQIGQVRISHCFRKANCCANFLAQLGNHQDSCFVLHHDLPVDLLGLLSSDRAGVYHIRSIFDPFLPP